MRFKEFSGEWERYKLEDVANVYDGTHQTPNYKKTGIPFVSVEDIKNINAEIKFISVEEYNKSFKIHPENGDILMTRIGDIGTPAIINFDKKMGYYVSLALLRPFNIQTIFLNYYIQTKVFKNELWIRTIHEAFPIKINKDQIGKCNLKITTQKEQQKIADFLTLVDKRIETQMKIIKEYKSLINGIREKVFTNYCGKTIKLCEVINEYCEKNTNNDLIPVAVGKYGIRLRSEIYTKELSKDLNKNKVVTKNTLIIGMGTKQIDIGILFDDISYCVSPAYTTYKIANINAFYLNELLIKNNPLLSKKYMIISARQGKSVNKKELLQHTLVIHNAQDQIKIVTLFQHLYKSLKEKEKLLDCFQKEKIYLLNNLFI